MKRAAAGVRLKSCSNSLLRAHCRRKPHFLDLPPGGQAHRRAGCVCLRRNICYPLSTNGDAVIAQNARDLTGAPARVTRTNMTNAGPGRGNAPEDHRDRRQRRRRQSNNAPIAESSGRLPTSSSPIQDHRALTMSEATRIIQLSADITGGQGQRPSEIDARGCGIDRRDHGPSVRHPYCFVTAGMGGGTGAAAVIARLRKASILTVGDKSASRFRSGRAACEDGRPRIARLRSADTIICRHSQPEPLPRSGTITPPLLAMRSSWLTACYSGSCRSARRALSRLSRASCAGYRPYRNLLDGSPGAGRFDILAKSESVVDHGKRPDTTSFTSVCEPRSR